MSVIYRILIADDIEQAGNEMRDLVQSIFVNEVVGNSVAIDVHPTIGFQGLSDEERVRELCASDCLISDLSWGERTLGYGLCQQATELSRETRYGLDVGCYTIIYSGTTPDVLLSGSQVAPSTDNTKCKIDQNYNLWYVKGQSGFVDETIATLDRLEEGIKWHVGRKIRRLLKDADRALLLRLKEAASAPDADPFDIADMPVVLADGAELQTYLVFGCYLPWDNRFPEAVDREIAYVLGPTCRDAVIPNIIGAHRPTNLVVHMRQRPARPEDDICSRDPKKRPTMTYVREERLLEQVLEQLEQLAGEPELESMRTEQEIAAALCRDIAEMIDADDEARRECARRRLGTTDTVRYRHLERGKQIERQVRKGEGVRDWVAQETVDIPDIPLKHIWRLRVDEFFHDEDDRFECADNCDEERLGQMAFLMFRPFLAGALRFWTSLYRPRVDVAFGKRQTELALLFTYGEGDLPVHLGLRGETTVETAPVSYYAKVAAEQGRRRAVMFEGISRPELAQQFWEGLEPPRLEEGHWRLAFRCMIL